MTDKDKLEKAVKLADAMYYAAQYMTTDASRLRKAMDEYHQFIITEYNKQEPAINREDIINSEQYKVSRASVDWYQAHQDADCLDGFEAGAQWQKEQMMKGAVEGKVVAVRTSMSDKLHTYPWIELEAQLSKNDKVKVIIIKG